MHLQHRGRGRSAVRDQPELEVTCGVCLIRPGGIGDCILSLPALEYFEDGLHRSVGSFGARAADPLRRSACSRSHPRDWICSGCPAWNRRQALIDRLGRSIRSFPGTARIVRSFANTCGRSGCHSSSIRRCRRLAKRFTRPISFFAKWVARVGRFRGFACPPAAPSDFAVIHPFSGSARKNWPLDRFRELAAQPAGSRAMVRGTGGSARRRRADSRICTNWAAGSQARALYIGNDSGITHLAAAVGTPVVAIFGPTDPAVWAPRGVNVRVVKDDLSAIHVEEVLRASIQALAEAQRTKRQDDHAENRQRQPSAATGRPRRCPSGTGRARFP